MTSNGNLSTLGLGVLACACFGLACSSESSSGGGQAEGEVCSAELPCAEGLSCTPEGECVSTAGPTGTNGLDGRDDEVCNAPDVLITLDVSGSLSQAFDDGPLRDSDASRNASKWGQAVSAIGAFTSAFDNTMRFGLATFPSNRVQGGAARRGCHPLEEWEGFNGNDRTGPDYTRPNNACDFPAEIDVPFGEDTAGDIAEFVTRDTTPLCWWTPIARAVFLAGTELESVQEEGREQFVVLVTDGKQTFPNFRNGCFRRAGVPFLEAQALAQMGIRTFVIGFAGTRGAIDPQELNDLACAGQMVDNLDENCVRDDEGNYRAREDEPQDLFLNAASDTELRTQLQRIASEVGCCDCEGIDILE